MNAVPNSYLFDTYWCIHFQSSFRSNQLRTIIIIDNQTNTLCFLSLQLCTFPVIQQFGLIFRDRFKALNITSSQMTTIINLNSAMTSIVGASNRDNVMVNMFTKNQKTNQNSLNFFFQFVKLSFN
jgi:hypothetical protein